jgi:hypothetical protein
MPADDFLNVGYVLMQNVFMLLSVIFYFVSHACYAQVVVVVMGLMVAAELVVVVVAAAAAAVRSQVCCHSVCVCVCGFHIWNYLYKHRFCYVWAGFTE